MLESPIYSAILEADSRCSDPDNYTDPPTFLAQLQRNHRVVPYDFWPLVADSTVIVQHVCSVAIFVCCFVGIYQERIESTAVVGAGNTATVLGWLLWDTWSGQEVKSRKQQTPFDQDGHVDDSLNPDLNVGVTSQASSETDGQGLAFSAPTTAYSSRKPTPNPSLTALDRTDALANGVAHNRTLSTTVASAHPSLTPTLSPKNQRRLATIKSAILIYCALLGLSPILMSLTKSTTSDSIWAISSWLMMLNVFFFDYGGGVGVRFPASLSTNAALMASTVLASRLTSPTHVFSLTLFSIEVFGLFPVFRRHLRHRAWVLHVALTVALIGIAGAALGVTLMAGQPVWRAAVVGVVAWGAGNALAMGGCSWWLIGLQKYKNVVTGPWDPARPVIRAGNWD